MDQFPEMKPQVGQEVIVTLPGGWRNKMFVTKCTPKDFSESGYDEIELSTSKPDGSCTVEVSVWTPPKCPPHTWELGYRQVTRQCTKCQKFEVIKKPTP